MNSNLRIVFMGTPAFAVPSLKLLLENNFNIVAVVTAPDKPAGRGRKLESSEICTFARSQQLKVLQPDNLKSGEFVQQLAEMRPDLQVVVAFRMLPEAVWHLPGLGTINLHASLLPQYRGAAPVNWVIINGEKETGLTTFFIDQQIDTGKIILQEKMAIGREETAGELHDRMMNQGAQLVVRTVKSIESGNYSLVSQQDLIRHAEELKTAPKITKETCRINWKEKTSSIHNLIRGLSPYPAAWTEGLKADGTNLTLQVFSCRMENMPHTALPGTVFTDHKTVLKIACADGFIHILDLRQAGKKRMTTAEFMRGCREITRYSF
jgi:methionyl-tRNA formyltransferase